MLIYNIYYIVEREKSDKGGKKSFLLALTIKDI